MKRPARPRWSGAFRKRRPPEDFRVTAIISVRTCEDYLERCFAGMVEQGVDICVIDNDANAETRAIIDRYRDRGIVHIERHPYPGYFDWIGILERKERLARTLRSDWIVLWDSDEIREAPARFATLRDALFHVDREGYNAVNFSEFVFLPTDPEQDFAARDYVAEMSHYYFFEPHANHRLTAWKQTRAPVDLQASGGHAVAFADMRVYPDPFVMRHYLFLSARHGVEKYVGREFSREELERGWSRERAQTTQATLTLPSVGSLKPYRGDRLWDRSEPFPRHPCFDYTGIGAR